MHSYWKIKIIDARDIITRAIYLESAHEMLSTILHIEHIEFYKNLKTEIYI